MTMCLEFTQILAVSELPPTCRVLKLFVSFSVEIGLANETTDYTRLFFEINLSSLVDS